MKVNEKETEKSVGGKDAAWHRRRIKRMKIAIIVVVILLLILPTICCIYLGLRVSRLQNQVEGLVRIHMEETAQASGDKEDESSYAYAAVRKPSDEVLSDQLEEVPGIQSNSEIQGQVNIVDSFPGADTVQDPEAMEQTASESAIQAGVPVYDPSASTYPTENGSGTDGNLLSYSNDTPTIGSSQLAPGTYPTDSVGDETEVSSDKAAGTTDPNNSTDIEDNKQVTDTTTETKSEDGEVKINSTGIYAGKQVYLTFDDGPSIYTDEILGILDEYGVKATFFVIGKKDKEAKRLYRKIIENGHTLGMHSYSHVYKQIYNSEEDFDKDFTKLWKLLYDTTGYMPTIYRFPGGSGNMVNQHGMEEFIRYLKNKSIVYYDWNVDNGDATGTEFTKEQLSEHILEGVAAKKRSIVLLHDAQGKRTTVDSLPTVLNALLSGGAEVLPLTEEVAPIQQIKAEDVK